MPKYQLFNKGDVIQTNPEEGFYGIAIVLSQDEGTPKLHPRCHMLITAIISHNEIDFSQLNSNDFKLIEFETHYTFALEKRKREPFVRKEIIIPTYTRRNVSNLKVLANIETENLYNGELPFEAGQLNSGIYIRGHGDPEKKLLGREAYINWKRKNNQ
ncbi:hypothetical protein ACFS5J_11235 [Flavobacterium chuncheonense]|uniref:Uncharacterized protein n=1 Tax=Flavobacterium chuncheonense TaxID=2026653 RepID=A0ABW5YQ74_9FLAO